MNLRALFFFLGHILRVEAAALLPALAIALWHRERAAALALGATILLCAGLSLLSRLSRGDRSVSHREGYGIAALSWLLLSLTGALPFRLSGCIPRYLDAVFEAVSGFTTTGASILPEVEALPMSLLYWRCFTNWLGGMGILVLVLAIVPTAAGKGDSLHVLRAESPGPSVGKLTPTLRRSARLLYTIYIVMTLLLIALLLLGGMPLFDSVTHALATAGTGGFSIKNASLAAYDSRYLQGVTALFMVLFGVNFNLYYLLLTGRAVQALRSEELRVYLGLIAAATLLIAWNLKGSFASLTDALHHAFFQVSTLLSTTGFATVDFARWPMFSRVLVLLLMLCGGCAGSTAGGMKLSRVLLLGKSVHSSLQRALHPRSVKVLKLDAKPVERQVLDGVQSFLTVYALVGALSLLLVALDNAGLETTATAVLSCLSNIGPGLGQVGPAGSFALFSPLSKLVLIADMLLGRLEFFPMLLLFAPSLWRTRPQ